MIELLFGIALASAIPLGFLIASELLADGSAVRRGLVPALGLTIGVAIFALAIERGPAAALLTLPWWLATVGLAIAAARNLVRELLAVRLATAPWRLGAAVATGFLAVGATWLVLDRAALQPFGFGRTIVLLTAVHFHVAGFVLTLTGSLAARRRPGVGVHAAVVALVVGTPLTALGFFGLPQVSWLGAILVAAGGIGIGLATIAVARGAADRPASALLTVAGATLFVTMPLAAAYASGTTFGIAFLDIPAMAAIHGGLNVVGFAIPAMAGWHRIGR
jgi:hypothetical protein